MYLNQFLFLAAVLFCPGSGHEFEKMNDPSGESAGNP